MYSALHLITVCTLVACMAASSLPFRDCGSRAGSVKSITLDPVPTGSCTYRRGSDVTTIVELELTQRITSLNVVAKGDVVVWLPLYLPNNDACTQGVSCPTTPGTGFTFKTNIPISPDLPAIRMVTRLEFKDESGREAICVEFPSEIC